MASNDQVEQSDSISSQDPHREETKKTKSRRPANTAFRQQRLKAWQPILTPKTVLPLFFIVGIIFAPIGGLLLYASAQVQEISIDYTDCNNKAPETEPNHDPKQKLGNIPGDLYNNVFKSSPVTKPQWGFATENVKFPLSNKKNDTAVCVVTFEIPDDIHPPVLFYYRLTNFYQNHRRYVKSLDVDQLKGKAKSRGAIKSGECDPLGVAPGKDGKPYYPCGLIANSIFNDTFDGLQFLNNPDTTDSDEKSYYNMSDRGIAWSSEGALYGETKYKPQDVLPPPNWADQFENGTYNSEEDLPNLHEWEGFQVWMRTAGLPTFSKLAMRNDKDVLRSGTYRLKIFDRFPAHKYGGTKSILISTRTVMGGRNPFLGIAYVVVGGLCIVLGAVFLATHLIKPRKLGDHTYLSWNNDQPSTATATGRSTRPGDTA